MKVVLAVIVFIVGVLLLLGYLSGVRKHLKPFLPTVFFEAPSDPNIIIVDFEACQPSRGVVSFRSSSIRLETWEESRDLCNFTWQKEGESWNNCKVPRGLGKKNFEKGYESISFESIRGYCEST